MMNGSRSRSTMTAPWIAPVTAPAASAASAAQPTGQPWSTFRRATIIAASERTEAIERS
jgi:hypothetical protein